MLKKIAALLLALCMLICLSACNKEETSSDISSDVSQTQSTDSQTEESSEADTSTDTSTQTSENTDKDENSSTPQSSTSKPTNTTNSNTSSTSKPTESSKPSSTTSKPTTSSTPSTSTPSTPSTPTVTKPTFSFNNSNRLCALVMTDTSAKELTADAIIHYYLEEFCYAIGGGDISADTVYETVSKNFVVDNTMKEMLKTSSYYTSSSNTFHIEESKYGEYYNGRSNCKIKGYTDLGNDKYTIYATVVNPNLNGIGAGSGETYYFKAEITYNSTKFIIHTFEIIDSIPSGVTEY